MPYYNSNKIVWYKMPKPEQNTYFRANSLFTILICSVHVRCLLICSPTKDALSTFSNVHPAISRSPLIWTDRILLFMTM